MRVHFAGSRRSAIARSMSATAFSTAARSARRSRLRASTTALSASSHAESESTSAPAKSRVLEPLRGHRWHPTRLCCPPAPRAGAQASPAAATRWRPLACRRSSGRAWAPAGTSRRRSPSPPRRPRLRPGVRSTVTGRGVSARLEQQAAFEASKVLFHAAQEVGTAGRRGASRCSLGLVPRVEAGSSRLKQGPEEVFLCPGAG